MLAVENTPTRLPMPPRQVHGGVGCGVWFARLFILPHMCVGVGLIGMFALAALVAAFGTDFMARVTRAYTSRGSKGGTTYNLAYQYDAGGRQFTNSATVGAGTYAAVSRPGDLEGHAEMVRVRHIGLGSLHYHLLTQERSAWTAAGQFLLFALFWNGIVSVFVVLLWVMPIRQRSLARHGFATLGTIDGSRVRRGKSTSYYATFRFTDPANGQEISREMQLPGRTHYEEAQAGRAVTVLYDPRKPKRAIVYELSGYRVAEADPG
jgi:hypothetical protein